VLEPSTGPHPLREGQVRDRISFRTRMNDNPVPLPECPEAFGVHDHVPMAHVADVERSIGFYTLLGFRCNSRLSDTHGRAYYAAMSSGQAELMLVRACGPVDANQQAVLFYMYSQDVHGLRDYLLSKGVPDAGRAPGLRKPGDIDKPIPSGPSLFETTYPEYMNEGELRVHDPDDYVILIGQCDFRRPAPPAPLRSTASSSGSLGQIALTVSDVAAAKSYYCDVIGLKLLFNAGPNLAFLSDGSVRIMLSSEQNTQQNTEQGAGKVSANSILYFKVCDIDVAYKRMEEKGSAIERPPQLAAKMPDHELWIAFLRDPDSNLVGIMEEKR